MPQTGPTTATATKAASRSRMGGDTQIRTGDGAFAELCLTTWLCRRSDRESWSGWRESNPRVNLGKVAGYHYITPAFRTNDEPFARFTGGPLLDAHGPSGKRLAARDRLPPAMCSGNGYV